MFELPRWVWQLALAAISPTFGMATLRLPSLAFIVLEVRQGFHLGDGLIEGGNLLSLQLYSGPGLQPVHEVEHHIFLVRLGI